MTKEIDLDQVVIKETNTIKDLIRDAYIEDTEKVTKRNLYTVVVEELSGNTRNTKDQIAYLDAFEKAVALFRATAMELRRAMDVLTLEQKLSAEKEALKENRKPDEISDLQKQLSEAIFFSNRYALFFAGNAGLAYLNSEKAALESKFSFGSKLDVSYDKDKQTSELAKSAAERFLDIIKEKRTNSSEITDDELKFTLESIFTSWINQFNWLTFKETAKKYELNETKIKFENFSLKEGEFKRKYDVVTVDEKFMDIRRDDVIGSQDFGRVIWDNLLKLGAYDTEKKKNPFDPASVIFAYGEPGGGKTFTSHALIQSFADLCRSKGIPLLALTHSTTDYASHYQNKTANELAALGGRIKEFQGPVIMYVADADNIFLSRKDPNLTAEQRQTLSVYFKMFDGTMIPKNGKFMAIMDANDLEGIDDATKSRLFDEITELKRFDKVDDFRELAKRSLTKGIDLVLTDQDWCDIGNYLLNCPLSNREISHIIKKLRRGFTIEESMLGKPYDELVKYRNEQLKNITKDKVIGLFEEYINTRMEIERKSLINMAEDDRLRFLKFLDKKPSETKPA